MRKRERGAKRVWRRGWVLTFTDYTTVLRDACSTERMGRKTTSWASCDLIFAAWRTGLDITSGLVSSTLGATRLAKGPGRGKSEELTRSRLLRRVLLTMSDDLASRARASLLGLALGDALGTTVEFLEPGSYAPLTGEALVGGGKFSLLPGQWTVGRAALSLPHCP